jgi:hypothetical protein
VTEGARCVAVDAPSTPLRVVPLPRVAIRETGEEKNCEGEIAREVSAVGQAHTVSNLVHRHTQPIRRQFAVWGSGQRADPTKDGLGWLVEVGLQRRRLSVIGNRPNRRSSLSFAAHGRLAVLAAKKGRFSRHPNHASRQRIGTVCEDCKPQRALVHRPFLCLLPAAPTARLKHFSLKSRRAYRRSESKDQNIILLGIL